MTRFPMLPAAQHATLRRGLAAAAAVLLGVSTPAWAGADDAALWAEAEQQHGTQHYVEALSAYERLARRGDAVAAERVGEMLLLRPAVHGDAAAPQRARAIAWLRQAADAGRPTAKLLVDRLEQQRAWADAQRPYVPGPHGC
ncbi:MAG: hypothetical protein MUC32_09590 [Burkholderiaceae bacterium]|jgi:TPR repeat protein|nr:hypothetical protein [Burkholderiaceae bacterium]